MRHRTALLGTIAVALSIADGFWVYDRFYRLNASITYVGADSLELTVPASLQAATFRNGKWDSNPSTKLDLPFYDPPRGQKRLKMSFVSLAPQATYSHALSVFHDLKARQICHVVVRESGKPTPIQIDFGKGQEDGLDLPAIVLCGSGYGDSGFIGQLPPDRLIHVDPDHEAANGS
ncbi:hypothetical protein U1701_06385 [Sphingomonas sp. PB2P19]|uniref:hypothetical protein n=1 Tax=Sphingomonas rhamnosi TaxID=3096156 RepID=UPI002FCBB93A